MLRQVTQFQAYITDKTVARRRNLKDTVQTPSVTYFKYAPFSDLYTFLPTFIHLSTVLN